MTRAWVAGYSRLPVGSGTLRCGEQFALRPRTLGGPNSRCHMEREKYGGNHRGYFPDCDLEPLGGLGVRVFLQYA